jgi:integrase
MRRGYQKGSLKVFRGNYVAQWRENGHRRNRVLGPVSKMTKSQARAGLAAMVALVNNQVQVAHPHVMRFREFIEQVFVPVYERKWKRSTFLTNEDRFKNHLFPEIGDRTLESITRSELQHLLDQKAAARLSYSIVAHLRWDLKQIFEFAMAEGLVQRNPASVLVIPKQLSKPVHIVMSFEEVRRLFSALGLRERLIVKLATLAGMRPGEIFGLTWGRLQQRHADIRQRIYRGEVDTPKTSYSVREAALSDGLLREIDEWKNASLDTKPSAWVFPSERMKTPVSKDNCWRRYIGPKLKAAGLGWVNFQVMRRTHSTLMYHLKVDPKVIADQLGHSVDVNQTVYTKVLLERRVKAVNELESALVVP